MTADGEEDKARNFVLGKATSDEPNAENKQDVETGSKCEESESKEPNAGQACEEPPPPTKKKEYNRYKHIQEVIEVPNSKAKAKSRGRPTEYAITENKLMPVDRDQDSKEIVKRDE